MLDKFKTGLLLLSIVIAFFLIAPHIPHFSQLTSKPRILVRYATAVRGRITGSEVSRQYHLYYLDSNTEQNYDFNAFTQPLTVAQQQLDKEEQNILVLGQRLETGDIVSKAANSTVLAVQRGESISRWFWSTPEEDEQAQKAAR